jgi:hypothetical protein
MSGWSVISNDLIRWAAAPAQRKNALPGRSRHLLRRSGGFPQPPDGRRAAQELSWNATAVVSHAGSSAACDL